MVLRRAVARNGRRLWTGTALAGLYQLCAALVPVLIGVIVDRAVATGDVGALVNWIGVLLLLYLILVFSYRYAARSLQRAIANESHLLRVEVAAKILHPRGLRTDRRPGDLLTISTTDAEYSSYFLDHIPRISSSLIAAGVSAATLLVISWPLGLIVLIATPIVLVILNLTAPLIARRVADQQDQAGRATSLATDLVTGLRPLRGIGAEDAAASRYRVVSRRSLAATLRASRTQNAYLAASTTLSTLLAGGIAIAAGWFALTGRITVGEFITVIGSAQFLIEPFGTLAVVPSWVATARASAARVASVTQAPLILPKGAPVVPPPPTRSSPMVSGPNVSCPNVSDPNVSDPNVSDPNVSDPNVSDPRVGGPHVSGSNVGGPHVSASNVSGPHVSGPHVSGHNVSGSNVSGSNVSDSHVSGSNVSGSNVRGPHGGVELRLGRVVHGSLAGLDLHVRAGEFVGVVAVRPADAEALVRLLAVPDAYEGELLLGGQRLETLNRDEARRLLHVEPHEADLFTGTLGSNIDVRADGGERIPEALRAAAADEVGDLEAAVTERGSNLSGGQRQRVTLARALLARPPLLVLHHPTTAVDAVTEQAIADGIRAVRRGDGYGTVVITSSPALLAAADRVVVIGDGAVIAEGRHAELVERDENYRRAVLR